MKKFRLLAVIYGGLNKEKDFDPSDLQKAIQWCITQSKRSKFKDCDWKIWQNGAVVIRRQAGK